MNWHKRASKPIGVINNIIHESIQLQKQDENYTCGAATIQNICRLLGKEMPSEDTLAKHLKTTKELGTSPESMEKVLAELGIPPVRFGKTETLETELSKNRVILAEFQDYQGDHNPLEVKLQQASHYALIVGFDSAFYYCVDSYLPHVADSSSCIKKIPKMKFHKDWVARSFDGSHVKTHWGLIIQV